LLKEWTFVADAVDVEDGPLDGAGVRWDSDRIGTLGTGRSLTVILDPPHTHRITCVVTDSDLMTGTDSITIEAFSPVVWITHPGDGETRLSCPSTIPWNGWAIDYEDGDIAASLIWMSSNASDGLLGTGTSISACLAGVGFNTVTATATDSDSNTASYAITLNIISG
jgi:hypothetical protein